MSPKRLPNHTVQTSLSRPQPSPEPQVAEKGEASRNERANGRRGRNSAAGSPGQQSRRRSEKLRPPPATSASATGATCPTTRSTSATRSRSTTKSLTSTEGLCFFNFLKCFLNSPDEDLGSRGNPLGDSCSEPFKHHFLNGLSAAQELHSGQRLDH